jgi:protein-tyrosine phosphatase
VSIRGRYGRLFLVFGLASLVAAMVTTSMWVRVVFLCIAPAALLMSWAYFRLGPGLIGKQPQGSIVLWRWFMLWPYHLTNVLNLHLMALLSRENAADEVAPGLFVSRRLTLLDRQLLAEGKIAAVLDATAEFPRLGALRGKAYWCCPLLDMTAPTVEQLLEGVAFVLEQRQQGPVLIHCAAGHGRSATFAAAVLLSDGEARDPDEAIEILRSKRPGIHLNHEQVRALQAFHERLQQIPTA